MHTLLAVAAASACLCSAATAAADSLPSLGEPEVVSEGHLGVEGPVAAPDGTILFSDVSDAEILRFDPRTGETALVDPTSGGANGLDFLGPDLVRCEGVQRRVTRTPLRADGSAGEPEVLAGSFGGKAFNTPNDLVVLPDGGGLFFTDPRYGDRGTMELDAEGVYALPVGGEPVRVIGDLVRPNGVTLSPDGRTLYVADEGARKVFAYPVVPASGGEPFGVGEGRLFADVSAYGNPDGMVTDAGGRLYVALFKTGKLLVLSPGGQPLSLTDAGERTSNVCLDLDEEHAYVTAGGSLLRFRIDAAG